MTQTTIIRLWPYHQNMAHRICPTNFSLKAISIYPMPLSPPLFSLAGQNIRWVLLMVTNYCEYNRLTQRYYHRIFRKSPCSLPNHICRPRILIDMRVPTNIVIPSFSAAPMPLEILRSIVVIRRHLLLLHITTDFHAPMNGDCGMSKNELLECTYNTIRERHYSINCLCPSCVVGQMKKHHKVKLANFVARPEELSFELSGTSNDGMVQTTAQFTVPLICTPLSDGPITIMNLNLRKTKGRVALD